MPIAARHRIHAGLLALIAPCFGLAQTTTTVSAPIPPILVAAQRIFISNAGSESYGSQSYFWRTHYAGGPDRFYIQFYAAMKAWGRFRMMDSPADAEVVYEVRFSNPVNERQTSTSRDVVEDPQLNLTMLDPATRVVLWSLTEHIELARTSRGDNGNFDDAVARLVGRVKALVADSTPVVVATRGNADPMSPGAITTIKRQARLQHAALGAAIAGGIATLLLHPKGPAACNDFTSCDAANRSAMRRNVTIPLSFGVIGAIVGWLVPVSVAGN